MLIACGLGFGTIQLLEKSAINGFKFIYWDI